MVDRSAMLPLVVSLDLELNKLHADHKNPKIIQIGAVVGDLTTGEVVSRFCQCANPHEALAPGIITLTGIKQADVDTAPDLLGAYQQRLEWLAPYDKQRTRNPLTWGGADSIELREELGSSITTEQWCFGRRWIDVKTVFAAWRAAHQRPWDGGLARSMTKLGLAFQGRRHNALCDAENTFLLYARLLQEFKQVEP